MKQCPGCHTQFADRDAACPVCRRSDAVMLPGTPSDVVAPAQRPPSTGARPAVSRPPSAGSGSTATRPSITRPTVATPTPAPDRRTGTGRHVPPPVPAPDRIKRAGTSPIAASADAEAPSRPLPSPGLPPGVEPRRPEELGWWPSGYRWGGFTLLLMFLPDVILATQVTGAWLFLFRGLIAFVFGLFLVFEKAEWDYRGIGVIAVFVIADIREIILITGGLNPDGNAWYAAMHAVMAVHAGMLLSLGYSNRRTRFWVKSTLVASALFLLSILLPLGAARHDVERSIGEYERIRLEKRDQDIAAFLKDHDCEARVWIAGDGHQLHGATHARAKDVVERLYARGAVRVLVGEIEEEDGQQTAWRLLVELPLQPDRRQALFHELDLLRPRPAGVADGLGLMMPQEAGGPSQDIRQRYESLSFGVLFE